MTDISDLKFDDKNFNKHTAKGMGLLEKSLQQFGAGRSILIDKDNNIIAGNGIVEAAGAVGLEKVKIVETTGDEIVAVKRTDVTLNSAKGREMALADNATASVDLEWDEGLVASESEKHGFSTEDWGLDFATKKSIKDEKDIENNPGKNTDHYVNFNLADFSELFGGVNIGKKLLKILPKPDIIVASPPCESWSHMTSINNGNIHWKRYASKLFPENKIFQLQDVDVQTGFVKNNGIKTFYTRVNGELCHQNTWEIIKQAKPKVFMVENPDNYSWEYIHKYIAGGIPKIFMNNLVYSAYEPERFSPKKEIFGSNIKLKLKNYGIYKNGNSIKATEDKNGFISKDYGTRSKIPELALKDFFEQAIDFVANGGGGVSSLLCARLFYHNIWRIYQKARINEI